VTFYTLAPAATNAPHRIAASWHKVEWRPFKPLELGSGECELIEQFGDQLLPMFTIRALQEQSHCVPHEIALNSFSLSFESLVPVAAPVTGK
jgi:hypothetical protein